MSRTNGTIIALVVAGLLSLGIWAGWRALTHRGEPRVDPQLIAPTADAAGFTRAEGPRQFRFPRDHGPHPEFQTEWWYYTGNLESVGGRHFGYQLTFFRRGLTPPDEGRDRPSDWATEQVYMAHFAITDVEEGQYQYFERVSRGAAGLAGAESPPFCVWLEDWRAEQVGSASGVVQLVAAQDDLALDLQLTDRKGPVLHGDGGYSRKGPERGNASYYYSQTRLETVGTVKSGGQTHQVEGWSWMDHEFSTSALGPNQVGWDWFALQLEDGSELMVFQIRQTDGAIAPLSSGTLVEANGKALSLTMNDFAIEVEARWRSPRSGATYPTRWTVRVPGEDIVLRVEPYVEDQELNVSYTYWEGAVRMEGARGDREITGRGYVELTGYAGSMQDQF